MSFPLPPLAKYRDTDFEVGNLLGRGTYTSVYSAVEVTTQKRVAMKIVDRYRCDRLKKTKDLFMEKHCLRRINHVNIVKMLAWFSDTLWVYVVMEECLGGELWEVVKTVGCPDVMARFYLAQVITALEYLRQANIVHRDIKAENIMLTDIGIIKLIDFGTAKDLENPHIKGAGNASRHKVFEDYVGTPQFMPQEVIENKSTDFRSDTWSLGCLVFQVLTGVPPFHAASEYLIFTRIMDMNLEFPPGVNPQAVDLIKQMLVKDADSRLGSSDLEEVRQHPYFAATRFTDAHLTPQPVLSLVDHCLQKIGRQINGFNDQIAKWDGLAQLDPNVKVVLERMQLVQKWQDDVLPPEE